MEILLPINTYYWNLAQMCRVFLIFFNEWRRNCEDEIFKVPIRHVFSTSIGKELLSDEQKESFVEDVSKREIDIFNTWNCVKPVTPSVYFPLWTCRSSLRKLKNSADLNLLIKIKYWNKQTKFIKVTSKYIFRWNLIQVKFKTWDFKNFQRN